MFSVKMGTRERRSHATSPSLPLTWPSHPVACRSIPPPGEPTIPYKPPHMLLPLAYSTCKRSDHLDATPLVGHIHILIACEARMPDLMNSSSQKNLCASELCVLLLQSLLAWSSTRHVVMLHLTCGEHRILPQDAARLQGMGRIFSR